MRVAMIAAMIALASSPALSSPSCMTQNEARAKFPAAHLWWHGPNRCWDATPGGRRYLAQRIKKEPKQDARSERDPAEEKKPDEKRRPGSSNDFRWREAMSRMRAEDMAVEAPARATASIAPVDTSPPRMDWRDRWVDVAQRFPPATGTAEPADLAADAGQAQPLVTPIRVMLVLLVLVLSFGVFELLRRPSRKAD
jgi:hypothetical protein